MADRVTVPAAAGAQSTAATIDTSNRFTVARQARAVMVMTPPRPADRLTPDAALALAAWLIAMAADPLERPAAFAKINRILALIS